MGLNLEFLSTLNGTISTTVKKILGLFGFQLLQLGAELICGGPDNLL
jgi:hypothetical protein